MPARARRSGDQAVMSAPSKVTRPLRTGRRPIAVLSSVVFPTPLRPMRQTSSPGPTSRSTPQSTCDWPYATSSPLMDSIGRLAPASEIDLEDARIALDLLYRALAEHRPLMEHRDLAGDLPHEFHVVLDDEDRPVGGDRLEQLPRPRGLLVGHAGDRLVHQQELRILRDHHTDLEPLLLAVRDGARLPLRLGRELHGLQGVSDTLALLGQVALPERGEDALRGPPERDLDVVPDREVHEDRRGLELPSDPQLGDLVLAERQEIGALAEDDPAALGLDTPGDDVEQRRLAGAVGADDNPELAPIHEEVEAAQRLEPVEVHGDVFEIDDATGGHWLFIGALRTGH